MNQGRAIQKKSYYKFVLLSLLGFLIFLCPVPDPFGSSVTIVIGIISEIFHTLLGKWSDYLTIAMMAISILGTVLYSIFLKEKINGNNVMHKLFYAKGLNLAGRLSGAVLLLMVAFNVGPNMLLNPDVGGTMFDLCVVVGIELIPAIILMPLLIDFGLMDFFGTMLNRFIRPVFQLPGRSSIDLLASWVGMVEMGLMVTEEQYAEGYYTLREATCIATCFTATGVAFWLVCAEVTGITDYLFHYFAAIFLVGIVQAIVCVRIPPLSRIPDDYSVINKNNTDPIIDKPKGQSNFSYACELGARKAENALSLNEYVRKIIFQNLNILITLVPIVMIIGVIALSIAEYTSVLDWLGYPFAALLSIFKIPDAVAAGAAVVSGFADMFLPMILISSSTSLQVKFIVTVVGITQVIFLSEVVAYLLNSKIPVKFKHMIWIFIERTVVAILVLIPFTNILKII